MMHSMLRPHPQYWKSKLGKKVRPIRGLLRLIIPVILKEIIFKTHSFVYFFNNSFSFVIYTLSYFHILVCIYAVKDFSIQSDTEEHQLVFSS